MALDDAADQMSNISSYEWSCPVGRNAIVHMEAAITSGDLSGIAKWRWADQRHSSSSV
jgi:hypothetical protein